ncbi:Flagellar basal-body rod protein FlgG [Rhodovulum sp. P5]|uniref:flagellar hook-basal body complex protein n=1 Tax=Rhodovulum sp. P5 TaxID=1564506 RepID=UPI0009C2616C|nr:flagellar hook-basal body complex protein [Rhodovulum sp. P5]ARE40402.1 Flagellar basal-body rod protein FlgG [Rhodovulum sp. P5]
MSSTGYTTLSRQSGLLREMQSVANNIANATTTGFRREGVIFSEYVLAAEGEGESLSMARAHARQIDLTAAPLTHTGSQFDFAIEGEGFFQVETPNGPRLTRAGSFTPNGEGDLVTPEGYRVLDAGGAPVFIPAEANNIAVAADGTLSADGQPLTQIGLFTPADPNALSSVAGTMLDPGGATEPLLNGTIVQGFVEGSNVDPISEIARMIEVQRTYEMGQNFLDREHDRISSAVRTLAGSN